MSVIDEAENDLLGIAGIVILIIIALLIYYGWVWWKSISVPGTLYPDALWSDISTGIDSDLERFQGTGFKTAIDGWLGSVYEWITSNLPREPESDLPTYGDASGEVQFDNGGY